MNEDAPDKLSGPTKSFMTAGPMLHYSHANVHRCWALAVIVFVITCLFWSKILTGSALSLNFGAVFDRSLWDLGTFVVSPLSIYGYPWQIYVLGLLMGIMASCPVLVAQLLSFRYSLVMVAALIFIAKLGLFGIFVLVSCVAAACRPLRFRSRFIAIALCMTPQLIYWAIFGGSEGAPIQWGFSFAPWICAWLTALAIAGVVLGVGHFTRYRPGLVWIASCFALAVAVGVFMWKISFTELYYQLYIAGNNPEEVRQFHDHQMKAVIDEAINDPSRQSFFRGYFYPSDENLLRQKLKLEIQRALRQNLWPNWLITTMPDELKYQQRKHELLQQYELFISKHPKSKRMPIALYYKAILNEYRPDTRNLLGDAEILRFYHDYPHAETQSIWYSLYNEFPLSSEAIEARWRIAMHIAAQGAFEKATEFCETAEKKLKEQLEILRAQKRPQSVLLAVFSPPAATVITESKLISLQQKITQLTSLINGQNHSEATESKERLAKFVILNPYTIHYQDDLEGLLAGMNAGDPLRDNILLAEAMQICDAGSRVEKLRELSENFANTDGGIRALYELGMANVGLWKEPQTKDDEKKAYLGQARKILTDLIGRYPESDYSEQAKALLGELPAVD